MNILWINNIAIPQIAEAMGIKSLPVGGWMVKLANEISNLKDIKLSIAFPFHTIQNGKAGRISYYSFYVNEKHVVQGNLNDSEKRLIEIIDNVKPDIIHIFGTEGAHSYAVAAVCNELGISDKLIVSIQGLVSVYYKHYYAYLDPKIVSGKTLRDLYKGNVKKRAAWMRKKGELEVKTLKSVRNVIGRTDWDKACTLQINPELRYFFNDEMLRERFYLSKKWSLRNCQKFSIFMSQATFPIKGLHLALEAVLILKKDFPEVELFVAGKSYYDKQKYKLSYYEKYILDFIDNHDLQQSVHFTGFLNEEEMVAQYLNSHVFVSPSSIENSPNSVCEAMMLGVPVVSSLVGGIDNLMTHGKEGYYYQADAPYMLAYYVKQIFADRERAEYFSKNEIIRAEERHNVKKIVNELTDIYVELCKK